MIVALCLLVLAGLTSPEPADAAILAAVHFLAPPQAASRADSAPWEIPDGVPVSLTIQNNGPADDRLLGGSTPVAQFVAVRRAFLDHGRRETALAPEGIVIPAGTRITLEPGKSHLALYGLQTDLEQGETFSLSLQFERAGEMNVVARVRRRVDAAGIAPLPETSLGDLTVGLASAPPAAGP